MACSGCQSPVPANSPLASSCCVGKILGMEMIHCPTCGTKFDAAHTTAMPFCTNRCRQIDLGRWFNEEYSVPATRDDDWDEDDDTPDDATNDSCSQRT